MTKTLPFSLFLSLLLSFSGNVQAQSQTQLTQIETATTKRPSDSNQELHERIIKSTAWLKLLEVLDKKYLGAVDETALSTFCRLALESAAPRTDKEASDSCYKTAISYLLPLAEFIPSEKLATLKKKPVFLGIGLELGIQDEYLKVVSTIESGAAHRGGVMAGDVILTLDGVSTKSQSLDSLVSRMRNTSASYTNLKIARRGVDQALSFDIPREEVKITSCRGRLLAADTGYLRASQFIDETRSQALMVIRRMEKENQGPLRNLILDLRGNPGGALPAIVGMAEPFIPASKLVLITKDKHGEKHEYRTTAEESSTESVSRLAPEIKSELKQIHLIILTDKLSGGGSESLIAALREYRPVTLMGEKTSGSNKVTEIVEIGNGSAIKMATATLYAPNEVSLPEDGIVPDRMVAFPSLSKADYGNSMNDPVLQAALLSIQENRKDQVKQKLD
ncbi:hypothetical protein UNDKW_4090 [Undibacterium sp. KW1]|uniref:S41 family peptidase n=1 Tax=Undibacterium sp. KW1 TaxID=2058624 RepID=UPI001331F493|nr:S41 family peptidase [Undibacterium sp. KW1]BBB62363.1 hypothetical protein UNDKW_4090 [Undibacterium sp. KW1]